MYIKSDVKQRVLYRIIVLYQDQSLQSDLNLMFVWSQSCQMLFNVNKCMTLRCNRYYSQNNFTYFLDSEPLNCVTKHSYLSVLLTSHFSHINNIVSKASKMLNVSFSKCCYHKYWFPNLWQLTFWKTFHSKIITHKVTALMKYLLSRLPECCITN